MAHIVFFHSAVGLDDGARAHAQVLEEAGHTVTTPDYYEGRTFSTAQEGTAYADEVGFRTLVERAQSAVADLTGPLVFAGISMGAAMSQQFGKRDERAAAAILLHAGGAPKATSWQAHTALQIHHSADDPWIEAGWPATLIDSAARAGARAAHFVYPGSGHLFADPSSPDFDAKSAALLWRRVFALLEDVDAAS